MPTTTAPFPRTLTSPDGRTVVVLDLDARRRLQYAVTFDGVEILIPSPLAIDLRQGGPLGEGMEVVDLATASGDETYRIYAGKAADAHDRHNEVRVSLRERDGLRRRIEWAFRAFDDAVAIRYTVPAQEPLAGELELTAERIEFRFPTNYRCWASLPPHFRSSHEFIFDRLPLMQLGPGALVGVPLTVEVGVIPNGQGGQTPAAIVAITEANLTDHAGMYLEGVPGEQPWLVTRLAPLPDGSYVAARHTPPFTSPWRVILLGREPVKLIESNVLYHLSEPNKVPDAETWVRPGRVLWDWWHGRAVGPTQTFTPGMNNDTMRYHIDFAAEMGFEYMLIDGGWYGKSNNPASDVTKSVPDIDLPALVRYANDRGVDLMLWLHWKDLGERFDEVFQYYHWHNIKGIKVDFFDRDDQLVVRYVTRLLEAAARYRLMVDLHGIYKPTGIERTYPHLMTHEGVYGMEQSKWRSIPPSHDVTIPFTRMLAGPMDYTPGGFDNTTKDDYVARLRYPMVIGTRGHQLAMYVVFESALQMVSDYPDAIRGQPGAEFLRVVPAAWDETRGLLGVIGRYVAIARRRGDEWFVGAMTGDAAIALSIPTDFLGGGGRWAVTIYADAIDAEANPKHLAISERRVRGGETIDVWLAPGGGCAMHLRRV